MANIKNFISDQWGLARAVAPTVFDAIRRGQMFNPQCELTPVDPEVDFEYDVHIPVADGFDLTACVFRSKKAMAANEPMPVVMCAHPYDNRMMPALKRTPLNGPPQQYRVIPQAGRPRFSEVTSWEAPDPNFWVPAGYAVVNLNMPGYGSSEGPPRLSAEYQAKCFYEAIEWVAARDWCTGDIGLNGVSYLAISQYHVATCQYYGGPPPSLKAISPWEGIADTYRDLLFCGGVRETGFPSFWWETEVKPVINVSIEEFFRLGEKTIAQQIVEHPFYDEYWRSMVPKLDEIDLPMLMCASFADHGLHTRGSLDAFMKCRNENKWLYTHRTGKWDSYYSPEVQELTRKFFDCFVRGEKDNGFLDNPRVRLEVRSNRETIYEVRDEAAWPIEQTEYRKLFLNAASRELNDTTLEKADTVTYKSDSTGVSFTHTFEQATEITGYMKVVLWAEARPTNANGPVPKDMVVFVTLDKLDLDGNFVPFYGCVGNKEDTVSRGCIAASRRQLDTDASTDCNPILAHQNDQYLKPGEVVKLEIGLWPSSTRFEAGESIRLRVAPSELVARRPFKKDSSPNTGIHVIHCGEDHESFLQIPIVE